MIPQRISIENFLSFGPETVFTFDESEPLWVLSGPNGVGKSTVFDAITYALFGCHRGGKQEHKELIRHGSNGFRIEFEFTYDGERFRLARSRNKKGRSIQTAESWREATGVWEPINIEDKASGLTDWVESTIGLDYVAFTSSVLLKQGEADAFIKAKAGPRLDLLKKIVQLQPFEELASAVHEATAQRKSDYTALQTQFSHLREVTAVELAGAEEQVTVATQVKETATEAYQAANQLVGQGTQYRQASARCQELVRLMQAAEERAARAKAIRAGYHRWNELKTVVPVLQKLEPLPANVKQYEELLAKCKDTEAKAKEQYQAAENGVEELESQRAGLEQTKTETRQRVEQLEQQRKVTLAQMKQVKELTEAEKTLAAFPQSLENELARVAEQVELLGETITEVKQQAFALSEKADGYRKQLRDFNKVKMGMPCSRCGQIVSKEHAAEEAKRLEGLIKDAETKLDTLKKEQDSHEAAHAKLKKQQSKLDAQVREMSTAKTIVETLQLTLRNQNISATLPELEKKYEEVERELSVTRSQATEAAKAHEAHITSINRMVAERKARQTAWELAKQKANGATTELEKLRNKQDIYLNQLPEKWKALLPIDRTAFLGLQQELAGLVTQNIAAEHDQLASDSGEMTARRDEYERLQGLLKGFPDEAKLPEAELQQLVQNCKSRQHIADQEYQGAINTRNDLQRRQAEHAKHAASLKEAEEKLRLHKRLDELLGKEGLQRKLVRNAEKELTAAASQTLGKLTNGELSLDLNPEGNGDEAFDLIVRQSNSSHTTSVNYLSGSQKFRVSVAIALAIGKYASGRNRPLESVIIDEGFGSLDRDGLDAMARELRELQRTAALKRIILVSHQEDFVQNFPVGYRLMPGDQGTTAERWNR